MNKSVLTEQLGAELGITHTEAERFLNALAAMIYEELKKSKKSIFLVLDSLV